MNTMVTIAARHMPRVFATHICDNERLLIFQLRKEGSGGKTISIESWSNGVA